MPGQAVAEDVARVHKQGHEVGHNRLVGYNDQEVQDQG